MTLDNLVPKQLSKLLNLIQDARALAVEPIKDPTAELSRLRITLTRARHALEQAAEYSGQALPHLADIQGFEHQTSHAGHFIKMTDAWIQNALEEIGGNLPHAGIKFNEEELRRPDLGFPKSSQKIDDPEKG